MFLWQFCGMELSKLLTEFDQLINKFPQSILIAACTFNHFLCNLALFKIKLCLHSRPSIFMVLLPCRRINTEVAESACHLILPVSTPIYPRGISSSPLLDQLADESDSKFIRNLHFTIVFVTIFGLTLNTFPALAPQFPDFFISQH